ncbi:DsbA family protein [Rhodococcus cerastii]|nr:DsbA family protein [Rhodococcus cerastii]
MSVKKKSSSGFIEAHDRRERIRGFVIKAGVTSVVVGLILAVGIAVFIKRSHREAPAPAAIPAAFTTSGGLTFGDAEAAVSVSVTEDFQCPACRQFEVNVGPVLTELTTTGLISVEDHPIAFLDQASTTQYSTRAANAAACVAEIDRDKWQAWKTAMFEAQPAEGGPGLTDDEIVDIAAKVGVVSPDLETCVSSRRYDDWVSTITKAALENGIKGTPYVTVNGEPISQLTPEGIRAAIAEAQ